MSELMLAKTIWQLRFPASELLLDYRGRIASEWKGKDGLSEWRIGINSVLIHNSPSSLHLYADTKELSAKSEMAITEKEFQQLAVDFTLNTLEIIQPEKITRVGLRFIFLLPHDNFRALVNKMRSKLYRLSTEDWGIFGGLPEDIGSISLILPSEDKKINFSTGPMEKAQLIEHFESAEARAKLPATSIFIDIDVYKTEPKWHRKSYPKHALDFISQGYEESRRIAYNYIMKFEGFK